MNKLIPHTYIFHLLFLGIEYYVGTLYIKKKNTFISISCNFFMLRYLYKVDQGDG